MKRGFTSVNAENTDAMFTAAGNELVQQIDDYQHNGSGWVTDQFIDVDLDNNNWNSFKVLNY